MTSKRILFISNGWEFLLSYRSHLMEILRTDGWEVHAAAPGSPPEGFAAGHTSTHSLDLSRASRNPLREIEAIRSISRLVKNLAPTAMEATTIKPVVYAALAGRRHGVPRVVLWCAGLGMSAPSSTKMFAGVERAVQWVLRRIPAKNGWTFVAENLADVAFLREGGQGRKRDVRMIRGRGVDINRFRPSIKRDKEFDLLFAGRFLRSKGVSDYVDAVRLLKSQDSSFQCALAGSADPGNPDSVDAAQVEAWRDEGLFSFLGSTNDMPGLLARTRALCFPSTYGEGAPRIVMEAAAAGVPVICVRSPALEGLVKHGLTGVFAESSAPAIADACASLLRNPQLLAAMGKAAGSLAEQEFGSILALEQTLALYNPDSRTRGAGSI